MKTCQQCDWTYKFELYSFKAPHLPLKQKYDVDCKGGLHFKNCNLLSHQKQHVLHVETIM